MAAVAAIFLSLPVVLLVGAYGWLRLSQTVAPGVTVGEIPVGGMRLARATELLDRAWNQELMLAAVDTGDAGRTWMVSPAQFGLTVDAAGSAQRAYAYARQGSLPSSILEMVAALSDGWEVEPIITYDPEAARVGLESLSQSAYIPAADAMLGLAAGEVSATPAQWGRQLDIESSLALLSADPEAILLRYGFIPLVTIPIQPAIADVAQAANEAERLLSARPTLKAYDPVADEWLEFTPTREQASAWLSIQRDGSGLRVVIEEEAMGPYLAGLQTSIGEERALDPVAASAALLAGLRDEQAETLQVRYRPRYYVVRPEDSLISISFQVGIPYWRWLEENPEVKARGLRVGESLNIPPRDAMLELPAVEGKRIVISISEQRMWIQEQGEVIREHLISTGLSNSPTLPGIYQVRSRTLDAYLSSWDLNMPLFLGIYYDTPNLRSGIHGPPQLSDGSRLWEDALGNPASYGTVILDLEAAEQLFNWAEEGVVVEIRA
ncbi:MAG: peptidoglycan binding domain-containing protein [Anaerolineales bacterium]|nr:peptidoglycan binding domain-containing protein [Anaerolineales bacterium]